MGELKNLAAEKPMVPMEPKSVNVSWKYAKDKDAMLKTVICALHNSGHYFVKPGDVEELSYDSAINGDWPTVLTTEYEFVWNPSYNRYIKYYRDRTLEYARNDAYAVALSTAINAWRNFGALASTMEVSNMEIEKVIFNEPATIVYWQDGTKTVVKCQEGDTFSKETGLAMAIAKKALGNEGNFNDIFRKWVKE